jgi:hypothetical protein
MTEIEAGARIAVRQSPGRRIDAGVKQIDVQMQLTWRHGISGFSVLVDRDAQQAGSIELSDWRVMSLISSIGDAAARIIFQIAFARVVAALCVLRLRATANYIAMQQEITPRVDRMKRKRPSSLIW